MKRKKLIWPALALSVILVLFCSAFFLNYQQNLSTVDDMEKELNEERNKNEALEKELDNLKEELEKLKKEYNLIVENVDSRNDRNNANPPADKPNPPANNTPVNNEPVKAPDDDNKQRENNPGGSGPIAYLTFDDGPSSNTIRILNTLKQNNIRATFFVTGNNTTGDEGIYRRIANEGHTLGNHTYTHNFHSIYKSTSAFMDDLLRLEKFLQTNAGVKTDFMRFPGGSASSMAQQVSGYNIIVNDLNKMVKDHGYDYFDWNVSSGDGTANLKAEEIVSNVLEGAKRVNGDIVVLFHDTKSKTTTADALPDIIRELDRMGYDFAPLTAGAINIKHR